MKDQRATSGTLAGNNAAEQNKFDSVPLPSVLWRLLRNISNSSLKGSVEFSNETVQPQAFLCGETLTTT